MTRILLWVGAAGPIVFLGVATLLGLLDADYDATSRPISELAVGPNGWLMSANFFLCGLSIIALALGLYRSLGYPSRLGTLLLSIAGLGMFAQGLFPIDLPGARETESGAIHNLLSGPIILGLILAYAFTANALRKEPGWFWHALCTALMPVVVLGMAFVFITTANEPGEPLYGVSGLLQRTLLAVAFGWITLTAGRLIKRHRREAIQWPTHVGDDRPEQWVANTTTSRGEESWR